MIIVGGLTVAQYVLLQHSWETHKANHKTCLKPVSATEHRNSGFEKNGWFNMIKEDVKSTFQSLWSY